MNRPTVLLLASLILATAACKADSNGAESRSKAAVLGPAAGVGLPLPDTLGVPLDLHILVDQFGYRPGDPKVAVIRSPRIGFDAAMVFAPGAAYEVRRVEDHAPVFAGKLVAWKDGAVQESSGDVGWWFDFSAVDKPGKYYVYDVEMKRRSATFRVDREVYRDMFKSVMRMYYYQRSAFEKKAPYAEACWVDGAAHIGPGQDREARDITDPNNTAKARDLSGAWFDAGDMNKYVLNIVQPMHQMLMSYRDNPKAFTDDFNIPESGNGVPDIIDEFHWGLEWLKKMQYADGTSAAKVGARKWEPSDPPSTDKAKRFYIPACTSATIAASGMFAHAAQSFAQFPQLKAEVPELVQRATKAFDAYDKAPVKDTHCDDGSIIWASIDVPVEGQEALAALAAMYLFAATGEDRFHAYFKAHYKAMRPFKGDIGWTRYEPHMGEGLLFYTTLPNADRDLKRLILDAKRTDAERGHQVYGVNDDDLYRNFLHYDQYHWGSNVIRTNYGNSNLDVLRYGVGAADKESFRIRALDTLHYLHGVNPFGIVYLTNMYRYGATYSVNEIYHSWFSGRTKWANARISECGPPPGFFPGGPNRAALDFGVPSDLVPPAHQPTQKAWRDTGDPFHDKAPALSEPSLLFQAGYLRLLSFFLD